MCAAVFPSSECQPQLIQDRQVLALSDPTFSSSPSPQVASEVRQSWVHWAKWLKALRVASFLIEQKEGRHAAGSFNALEMSYQNPTSQSVNCSNDKYSVNLSGRLDGCRRSLIVEATTGEPMRFVSTYNRFVLLSTLLYRCSRNVCSADGRSMIPTHLNLY